VGDLPVDEELVQFGIVEGACPRLVSDNSSQLELETTPTFARLVDDELAVNWLHV
jgi:hypothetical protein